MKLVCIPGVRMNENGHKRALLSRSFSRTDEISAFQWLRPCVLMASGSSVLVCRGRDLSTSIDHYLRHTTFKMKDQLKQMMTSIPDDLAVNFDICMHRTIMTNSLIPRTASHLAHCHLDISIAQKFCTPDFVCAVEVNHNQIHTLLTPRSS